MSIKSTMFDAFQANHSHHLRCSVSLKYLPSAEKSFPNPRSRDCSVFAEINCRLSSIFFLTDVTVHPRSIYRYLGNLELVDRGAIIRTCSSWKTKWVTCRAVPIPIYIYTLRWNVHYLYRVEMSGKCNCTFGSSLRYRRYYSWIVISRILEPTTRSPIPRPT